MKTLVILCRIPVIADAFRVALQTAEPRIDIHVFATSAEYAGSGKAPESADLAVYLASGNAIQIAATFAAISRHGVAEMITVHLGDDPLPTAASSRVVTGGISFAKMLSEIRSTLRLPKPETAVENLPPQRQRVLRLVAQTLTNDEIAARLRIHVSTVAEHVRAIQKALGARNRMQAALIYRLANPQGE